MKPYRVLIAEDFLMTRQLFENIINAAEDFELVASFPDADSAVAYTAQKYVDLVIMDIVMQTGQSGLSAAKRIKDTRPETKILIVTSMPEITYIDKARRIGVESFWYKEIQEQPILEIIRRTMQGESIYPDSTPVIRIGNAVSTEFTEKEAEVLRELTDGASNKEIAEKLGITERTVKMHITNMIQKTGFRSRLELAVKARVGGLVIPLLPGHCFPDTVFSDIQFRRFVDLLPDVFPVLFPLLHAFRQQIFDLPVDGAEVVLRPGGEGFVQTLIQAQRHLLLLCHPPVSLIQRAAVDDRLRIVVAAQDHKQVGDHGRLALLIQRHHAVVL